MNLALLRSLIFLAALTPLLAQAADKPLRIYILVGQSNMVGQGAFSNMDYIGEDPATKELHQSMLNEQGDYRTCDRVWISSLNGKMRTTGGEGFGKLAPGYGNRKNSPSVPGECIGPEYTFGITMEKNYDGPILIIKAAWGGHSLCVDYRSPSAGPYVMPEAKVAKLGRLRHGLWRRRLLVWISRYRFESLPRSPERSCSSRDSGQPTNSK